MAKKGHIIELYKIVKGHEEIEWVNQPRLSSDMELEDLKKG